MIVKDENTLMQALDLLKAGPVRCATRFVSRTVEDAEVLDRLLQEQLEKGDIAVVTLRDSAQYAEDYGYALKAVQRERRMAEQKAVRKWVTEHPVEARKFAAMLR